MGNEFFENRGYANILLCPSCQSINLHHERIIAYERVEDNPLVQRIEINGQDVRVSQVKNSAGNPSARRHGVAIQFWCEQCHKVNELTIAQHKGETEVGWREIGSHD
jgi:hypothetical protein